MSISSLPRWKHPRASRCERRRKEREAGRAEKKRLWHSFPMPTQRDLLDLSIRAAVLARGNGALDFEKRTEPFRHRVVSYWIQSASGKTSGVGCRCGADIFPLVRNNRDVLPRSLFFSCSVSLSLFISVTSRTCRVSSVFILRFSLSLFLSRSAIAPPFLSLCISVSFYYLLHHFSQLSFSRSFRYLTSCQLSP